ncbi:MAG: YhgE/Pip domain-containing protein [Bifidobacteriaceae bacterium]|nr:YhgE/Pip domain-containing protein [Bifidobacteriaceae bacterium]
MNNIIKIFVGDIHRITKTLIGNIICIGLILIPALFSWYNIGANWDPFANMKNLNVAVANTDKGYKSDLVPITINVGDNIVNQLRANTQMNWTITNSSDAIEGTKSGKYYAAIIIPNNFSKKMMTFFSEDNHQALLDYYTNEKLNAVAPKFTGQGAQSLSRQVNTVFAKTITETALEIASGLSENLQSPSSMQLLANLNNHIDSAATQLDNIANTLTSYTALNSSADSIITTSNKLIHSSVRQGMKLTKDAQQTQQSLASTKGIITNTSNAIQAALASSNSSFQAVAQNINNVYDSATNTANDSQKFIDQQASLVQEQIDAYQKLYDNLVSLVGANSTAAKQMQSLINNLKRVHSTLVNASQSLQNNTSTVSDTRKDVQKASKQASDTIASITKDYQTNLEPQLSKVSKQFQTLGATNSNITSNLNRINQSADSTSAKMHNAIAAINTSLNTTAQEARTNANNLRDFHNKLQTALQSEDINQIKAVLQNDATTLSAKIASPVSINRTVVYPIPTFGAALSPLYTFVPLWFGVMLLSLALKIKVGSKSQEDLENPKAYQLFLGRYITFLSLSLLQTTLTCGGTLLFLKLNAVHPWLFMLTGWLSSITFCTIVFTLSYCFGNIGKAACIVLLIFQTSATGSAYPIQLVSGFMQALSPFFPITYSTRAIRAAISGIYGNEYWSSMLTLIIFILPFLIFGLLFNRILTKLNEPLEEKIESTKILL